ncbi:MAG: hypothetical protein ACE5HX_19365, partial [bacterium]
NSQSDNSAAIRAKVNVIETFGKETFLELSTGQHSLAALLDGDINAKPHQDIMLVLDLDKIHLFKKDNGEALF